MIASRRGFLLGAGATLLAAPSIVRVAANLMPVSAKAIDNGLWLTSDGTAAASWDAPSEPEVFIRLVTSQHTWLEGRFKLVERGPRRGMVDWPVRDDWRPATESVALSA